MNPVDRLRQAPRCSATSKRTGHRCRAPAVKGRPVCRFHGARAGAPRGCGNGAYRHGHHTRAAKAERRAVTQLLKASRQLLSQMP